jgi:hypothetical protein
MGLVTKQPGADEDLANALKQAQSFGCKTVDGRRLLVSAQVVTQLRQAIARDDWDGVEKILLANKMGDAEELIKTVCCPCNSHSHISRVPCTAHAHATHRDARRRAFPAR